MRDWNVPGYTEIRALGSGGFGEVVLARRDASGTLVAIKYLRQEMFGDPESAGLFRAEAAVLASIDDPNVVRLYEYVEGPANAAIVMELVDGVSLREILSTQGKTSAEAALVVLQGSLLGLAAAHKRGVVHRDYKPENVLVDGAGASKLTDFGIAARAGEAAIAAGTLAYAPPEQFAGAPASAASDVYAATATFYECLVGRPPFTGQTREELQDQHRSAPVPMEPVPEPLRPLIAAGMAKDPEYRPADADTFVTALRAIAWPAYGRDWEDRGRSHLGELALLLAALWPSGAGPAAAGHTAAQVHLSPGSQEARNAEQARHLEHVRHVEHAEHVEHLEHAEHAQHVEHVEHVEHLEHIEHVGHAEHVEQAGHLGQASRSTLRPSGSPTSAAAEGTGAADVTVGAGAGAAATGAASAAGATPLPPGGAGPLTRTAHYSGKRVLRTAPGKAAAAAVAIIVVVIAALVAVHLTSSPASAAPPPPGVTDNISGTYSLTRHITLCSPAGSCITGPLPLQINCPAGGSCTASSTHWGTSHPVAFNGTTISISGIDQGVASTCDGAPRNSTITLNLTVVSWTVGSDSVRRPKELSGPYNVTAPATGACVPWHLEATMTSP
jgi:eukaryotic-like serine/threonine-protein kinase